MMKGTLIS